MGESRVLWVVTSHGAQLMFLANPGVDVRQPLARGLTLTKG